MSAAEAEWAARWGLRPANLADVPAITAMQLSAYAPNRTLLGCEPLPLQADYNAVIAEKEAWVSEADGGIAGLLVMEAHPDFLHLWNVSVAPHAQGFGLGGRLLSAAEDKARCMGFSQITLMTGQRLQRNVDWYRRRGYCVTNIEDMPDRRAVHFHKTL